MDMVTREDIIQLKLPIADSHKGQNGRLLLIGGSHYFHAASLWSLTVASRLVDLVHYASVPENNSIVSQAKQEFRNGIVVSRIDIEACIAEDDAILIGPGMVRSDTVLEPLQVESLEAALNLEPEGLQTMAITNYLLKKYPEKLWIIDAGALQMVDLANIPKGSILTPHQGEFEGLWQKYIHHTKLDNDQIDIQEKLLIVAKSFEGIILLKGKQDLVADGLTGQLFSIDGGNAGMTKGGTGDVLAGLIAGLACNNPALLATKVGSFVNKRAGDALFERVGPFFNASDLAEQIPITLRQILL